MVNNRSIQWRKLRDPTEEHSEKIKQMREELNDEEKEVFDSNKELIEPVNFNVLSTPIGLLPITESNLPSNNFDLWIWYTNFNIDESFKNLVDSVDGVEIFDVYSRYTFRIGIGRHKDFSFANVRRKIDLLLNPQTNNTENNIDSLKNKLSKYKNWAILVLPNGVIHSISSDDNSLELGKLTMFIFNLHLFKNDNYAFAKKENKLTWKG